MSVHKICSDGSTKDVLLLSEPVTEEFLEFLARFGSMKVRRRLKKPAFSFEKEKFISVRGILGEREVEMRRKEELVERTKDYFEVILASYDPKNPDEGAVKKAEEAILSEER